MRNIRKLRDVEANFDLAMQKGDAVQSLRYLRELTARSLNAEYALKEDMLQTICQLEKHCAFLETRRSILDMFAAFSFVLGVVYHDYVIEIGTRILDFVYGMVIV